MNEPDYAKIIFIPIDLSKDDLPPPFIPYINNPYSFKLISFPL